MSRLKELRLHGFKSFADPTRFVFEPGVNAVIGPNGSGKSNMADAVRWVLGEQSNRYLRTRRAEDVIFAGSESRRPQGMAEAVMTLDNADGSLPIEFAEVSIGRRAYRSGESEYLINGARARLRDIVDLLGEGQLGANALVVVGQGTVDAALSLRPEERRQLFEEAAGVKTLQVRKNEALSRLARATDNLTRVADLVAELKPQVRRLALQAEHQQEHASLGRRARALVTEAHRRRERSLRAMLGDARRAAAGAEAALEAHRAEQEAGRARVRAAEAAYWEAEAAARAAGESRAAAREALVRAEGRLEAVTARATESRASVDEGRRSLEEARAALAQVGDPDGLEASIAPALEAARSAEAAWRAAIDRLAAADATLMEAEERLARARADDADRIAATARAAERRAGLEERVTRLERELSAAREHAAGATDRAATATRDAAARRDAVGAAREAATGAEAAHGEASSAAEAARRRLGEVEQRLGSLEAELQVLDERAAHGERLAPRLVAAGWRALLDAIDPPRDAWAAVEAVLGGALDEAVLWDGGDPAAAAADAGGTARLVASGGAPADDGRAAALAAVGAERTLADWLATAEVPRLLARVAVAPSLERLLTGWADLPPGWLAVTAAGDLADGRGLVTVRGRDDPHAGEAARLHARRREVTDEVATLRDARDRALAAVTDAQTRLAAAAGARERARDALEAAERDERRAESARAGAEAEATRLEAEVRRLDEALTAAREAAARLPGLAAGGEDADATAVLAQAATDARQHRDAAAAERDRAREGWQMARGAAEAAEARSAGRRGERALLEGRIAALEASLPDMAAIAAQLEAERDAAAAAVELARADDGTAAEAQRNADAEREARRRMLLELEHDSGAAAGLAELERAAQTTAIEAQRAEDALAAAARERELALEGIPDEGGGGADGEPLDALDDEAIEVELRRVRRTLGQIGSVNPFAIEEHRELAERLDGLTSQEDDLRAAIGSTEELIATLDGEITERFNTAFAQIATRFDEFCQLLFAGGSGSLQLGDGEEGEAPGGIEIVVRPPGKRLQRLAMLSGGERALTGVALLFAMLSVNPVPFCILDEVDAALDEANIGRFADALRKLSEAIDFVVITHNRATIEVADTIYGVTMTDAAVSRVLSLRLSDVPAEVSA